MAYDLAIFQADKAILGFPKLVLPDAALMPLRRKALDILVRKGKADPAVIDPAYERMMAWIVAREPIPVDPDIAPPPEPMPEPVPTSELLQMPGEGEEEEEEEKVVSEPEQSTRPAALATPVRKQARPSKRKAEDKPLDEAQLKAVARVVAREARRRKLWEEAVAARHDRHMRRRAEFKAVAPSALKDDQEGEAASG